MTFDPLLYHKENVTTDLTRTSVEREINMIKKYNDHINYQLVKGVSEIIIPI